MDLKLASPGNSQAESNRDGHAQGTAGRTSPSCSIHPFLSFHGARVWSCQGVHASSELLIYCPVSIRVQVALALLLGPTSQLTGA
mmetsp:Transcript_22671/g.56300  ORF Transcript_22671/g.56300 Transcript_22671/m.56300 type:complete len:85 (+) Transcript_22671:39-293(+)